MEQQLTLRSAFILKVELRKYLLLESLIAFYNIKIWVYFIVYKVQKSVYIYILFVYYLIKLVPEFLNKVIVLSKSH